MSPPDIIPSSRKEADAILNEILKFRDTAGDYGVKAMTQALEVIAKKLYSKSTPFIAELIQNADDNTFRDGIPSLEFTLMSGDEPLLLVECNESPGLTAGQVDSLCDVGNSTKKQQAGAQRTHTGEKGIGFKSVFKVADVVDVRSGFFEFRLDNTKRLGMLRPLVHDFPMPRRARWTQILLHIRSPEDYDRVYASLKGLKPEQMLFLRSLQCLKVSTPDFESRYRTSVQSVAPDAGIKSLVISDGRGNRSQEYFLLRTGLHNMPADTEERGGVSGAELILGFPISPPQGRPLPTQCAYAFLPICDFGFKFIIQADFVLVASREGLQEDLEWNTTLRDAIPDAFARAVDHFNRLDLLGSSWARYHWPEFLQYSRGDSFWRGVTTAITKKLQVKPVFESRAGNLRVCSDLLFVPRDFRTSDSLHPRIDLKSRLDQHLSFQYDRADDEDPTILVTFGVKKMTTAILRQDLEEFLGNTSQLRDGRVFSAVDAAWRDLVASAFKQRDISKQKNQLSLLPIVPIQTEDGVVVWEKPSSNTFFSTDRVLIDHLAKDLDLRVVDSALCTGTEWERLVRSLGVCDLNPAAAIKKIWIQHEGSHKRKIFNWIKDVVFLFHARFHIPEDLEIDRLSFLTLGNEKRLHGNDVYIRGCSLIDNAVSLRAPINIISQQYFEQLDESEHVYFMYWLTETCGVAREPRLLRNGAVTADWTFFAHHMGDELLIYLRDHPELVQESAIRQALSFVAVSVRGQAEKTRVGGTALPTTDLLAVCPNLTFVDLPTLSQLTWMQTNNSKPTMGQMTRLYRVLNDSPTRYEARIRNAFGKPLVYDPSSSTWRKTDSFIRGKPDCILAHDALPERYLEFPTLFGKYAHVRSVTCRDVLAEIQNLDGSDGPDNIARAKELINVLDTTLREGGYAVPDWLPEALLKCRFLPARTPRGTLLCTAENCYIPDEAAAADLFARHFPMIDTSLSEIAQLRPLIDCLGLQRRLLSVAVLRNTVVSHKTVNDARTAELRRKVQWFCKLSDSPTPEMLKFVSETTVWDVHTITANYVLEERKVKRTTDDFWVEKSDDGVNIFLSSKATQSTWAYVDHDLVAVLAEECSVKKAKIAQLLPTLLRISADEIPALLERQKGINRANFELVDGWIEGCENGSDGTVSNAGDPDSQEVSGDESDGYIAWGDDVSQDDGNAPGIIASDESITQDDHMGRGEGAASGINRAQNDSQTQDGNEPQDDNGPREANATRGKGVARDTSSSVDNESNMAPGEGMGRGRITSQRARTLRERDLIGTVCFQADSMEVDDAVDSTSTASRDEDRHRPVEAMPPNRGAFTSVSVSSGHKRQAMSEDTSPARISKRSRTWIVKQEREEDDDCFPDYGAYDSGGDDSIEWPAEEHRPVVSPARTLGTPRVRRLDILGGMYTPGGASLDVDVKGEMIVHDRFCRRLRGWNDEEHWTGRLERHDPANPRNNLPACFTFTDSGHLGQGSVVSVMESLGLRDPFLEELRGQAVTYHIDVKATAGEFEDRFTMTWSQHTLARNLMFRLHENPEGRAPESLYLLVRVCRVHDDEPEMHFLLDPWSDVAKGRHVVRFSEAVITPSNPNRFRDAFEE